MTPASSNLQSGYGHLRYLVVAPLLCLGLGTWQIFRLRGKLELIEQIKARYFRDPVPLSSIDFNALTAKDLEYTHVYVSGEFEHDKEMYVGFKQPQVEQQENKWTLASGSVSSRGNYGFHVVTPFILDPEDTRYLKIPISKREGKVKILVNRGWVPKFEVDPSKRPEGQVKGKVLISGYLRSEEKKFLNMFIEDNCRPGNYLFREVNKMAEYANTEPIMIELDSKSSSSAGPVGGQTKVQIYNKHVEYIATWYGIAMFTGYLWYKHVYQAKPFSRKLFFKR